ncbi:MAG: phosphoesterase PA-phosphatase related protein [Thermoleophilia bacterium]|jgi:acid phosphatase (class A)|nr:phosphoesterase PA-phosphatase related protein [Thermoleophilia bacterium]
MMIAPIRPRDAGLAMPGGLPLPPLTFPSHDEPGLRVDQVPAPPASGSAAAAADLAALHVLVGARTPLGNAWATALDLEGHKSMWNQLAAQTRGDVGALQALVGAALAAGSLAAREAKAVHQRLRPFEVDPTLRVVGRTPTDSSYPSGHTTKAWAAARVIAAVDPRLADAAYGLAREVAISRMYAGVHFPSDVIMGAQLGVAVGQGVLDAALGTKAA